MENLSEDMERVQISDDTWLDHCMKFIEQAYCPEKTIGFTRPCEEKDFADYIKNLDNNLEAIERSLEYILQDLALTNNNSSICQSIGVHLILIVGEQSKKNIWNTAQSPIIVERILQQINRLYSGKNISQIFSEYNNEYLTLSLAMLQPKLLQTTWKSYPAAIACYQWILQQLEGSDLIRHISSIFPTALIIYDDYIPENRIIGLQCFHTILQHSSMHEKFVKNGYNDVIYDALEKLTYQRDVRYIIPLYVCLTQLLKNLETWNSSQNRWEWSKRDHIIGNLLDNMEFEQDLERRHAYIKSLSQLLTNPGCARWCGRIVRIISEYCSHHTDLRTLSETLHVAETVLTIFNFGIPAHCLTLYSAFFKLHFDLTETPTFNNDILKRLERCIYLLYKLTPSLGSSVLSDNRMRKIMNNSLYIACGEDIKYCN